MILMIALCTAKTCALHCMHGCMCMRILCIACNVACACGEMSLLSIAPSSASFWSGVFFMLVATDSVFFFLLVAAESSVFFLPIATAGDNPTRDILREIGVCTQAMYECTTPAGRALEGHLKERFSSEFFKSLRYYPTAAAFAYE